MASSTRAKSYSAWPSTSRYTPRLSWRMPCARTERRAELLAEIRNASASSSPTWRPPGPMPRSSIARCSEPIIGRHGRSTGPRSLRASTAISTAAAAIRPGRRPRRARTAARPARRSTTAPRPRTRRTGHRSPVVSTYGGCGHREQVARLVVDRLPRPVRAVGPMDDVPDRACDRSPVDGHVAAARPAPGPVRRAVAGRRARGGCARSAPRPRRTRRSARTSRPAGRVSRGRHRRLDGVARAGAEGLEPDDRPEDLPHLLGRERISQDVVLEGVADRGHDDPLVERQVRVGYHPGVDVDRVTETPLAVDVEVGLEVGEVVERHVRAPSAGPGTRRAGVTTPFVYADGGGSGCARAATGGRPSRGRPA